MVGVGVAEGEGVALAVAVAVAAAEAAAEGERLRRAEGECVPGRAVPLLAGPPLPAPDGEAAPEGAAHVPEGDGE